MFGLDQTADVYIPNGTDGDFTTLARSDLVCRLAFIQQGGTDIGGEREDLGQRRRLLWTEVYTMPETAQIEVDGERFNVIAGTFGAIRGPSGAVDYRRCEVVSAVS